MTHIHKKLLTFFLSILLSPSVFCQEHSHQYERLKEHVTLLASDSLNGRKAGTADAQKAASYIITQFTNMGLSPYYDSLPHSFTPNPNSALSALANGNRYCNIIGYIEGCDSTLKKEIIIVGAHYDHLGIVNGEIHNGADDNASGTAAIIEIARQLLDRKEDLKRSVMICAFDAEEIGLIGSDALAHDLEQQGILRNVKMMMSVDMVGWLYKRPLQMCGTATLDHCDDIIHYANTKAGKRIKIDMKDFETSVFTATDTRPFKIKTIPTLAITTGLKSPYHKPEDDAELIDYNGLDNITNFLSEFTIALADGSHPLDRSRKLEKRADQRPKPVDLGFSIGLVNNQFGYAENDHISKAQTGFTAGLSTHCNISNGAKLIVGTSYALLRSPMLDADQPFAKPHYRHQHAIHVPFMLCKQFNANVDDIQYGFYIGLGGFYNYIWADNFDNQNNSNQYGFQYCIGYKINKFAFEVTRYHQTNNIYTTESGMPETHNTGSMISLKFFL